MESRFPINIRFDASVIRLAEEKAVDAPTSVPITTEKVEADVYAQLHYADTCVSATHGLTASVVFWCINNCAKNGSLTTNYAELRAKMPYFTDKVIKRAVEKLCEDEGTTKHVLNFARDSYGEFTVKAMKGTLDHLRVSFDPAFAELFGAMEAVIFDAMMQSIHDEHYYDNYACLFGTTYFWRQNKYVSLAKVRRAWCDMHDHNIIDPYMYYGGDDDLGEDAGYYAIKGYFKRVNRWRALHGKPLMPLPVKKLD